MYDGLGGPTMPQPDLQKGFKSLHVRLYSLHTWKVPESRLQVCETLDPIHCQYPRNERDAELGQAAISASLLSLANSQQLLCSSQAAVETAAQVLRGSITLAAAFCECATTSWQEGEIIHASPGLHLDTGHGP